MHRHDHCPFFFLTLFTISINAVYLVFVTASGQVVVRLDLEDLRWHISYMAGRGERATGVGLMARATRFISRLNYQVTGNNDREGTRRDALSSRPGIVSSDSDEACTGEVDDEGEYQDEESELYAAEVSYNERPRETRVVSGGSDGCETPPLNHVLAQSTLMQHCSSERSARLGRVKRGAMVNAATMLFGREFNVSGNGRFSRAECCHMAARYLPTDGPTVVDHLNSRAYIGQFSANGTSFVAGFQVILRSGEICCAFWIRNA